MPMPGPVSFTLPPPGGSDVSSQLLLQCHVYMLAALLPAIVVRDSPFETVNEVPIRFFLL